MCRWNDVYGHIHSGLVVFAIPFHYRCTAVHFHAVALPHFIIALKLCSWAVIRAKCCQLKTAIL